MSKRSTPSAIVTHPHRDLMLEAMHESEVTDSREPQALQEAIFKAVDAYSTFLDRKGVIWEFGVHPDDPDLPRLKAQALVVTLDYGRCTIEIKLKDGAIDRVYGNGVNPDPEGLGPSDIPHKPRNYD